MIADLSYRTGIRPVPLFIRPASSVLQPYSITSAMLVQKLIGAAVIGITAVQCAVIPASQSEPQSEEGHQSLKNADDCFADRSNSVSPPRATQIQRRQSPVYHAWASLPNLDC